MRRLQLWELPYKHRHLPSCRLCWGLPCAQHSPMHTVLCMQASQHPAGPPLCCSPGSNALQPLVWWAAAGKLGTARQPSTQGWVGRKAKNVILRRWQKGVKAKWLFFPTPVRSTQRAKRPSCRNNLAKIQWKASNESLRIACCPHVCDGYLLILQPESCTYAKQWACL